MSLAFSKETNPASQLLGIILLFSIYSKRYGRQFRIHNNDYPCASRKETNDGERLVSAKRNSHASFNVERVSSLAAAQSDCHL
jgi:hypothetical protein